MGAESAESASTPTGAVFLNYASQDAESALRVCRALQVLASVVLPRCRPCNNNI